MGLFWNSLQKKFTGLYCWCINIDSGNGLVPSGTKPLPKPMLIQIYAVSMHPQATMS